MIDMTMASWVVSGRLGDMSHAPYVETCLSSRRSITY